MIKIKVLGCCVSREMFNYTDRLEVTKCVYTPFITLNEPPFPVDREAIDRVAPNRFFANMLDLECRKKIFGYLKEGQADYLILDFAETVTDFYRIENGVRLPATEHYKALVTELHQPYERQKYTNCSVESIVKKLFEELSSVISSDKIILNRATYSKYYLKEEYGRMKIYPFTDHFRLLPEAQARVREFENQALKYLGGAPVLPPLEACLSDGAHKYGVSPVHYADCSYRFMARRLEHTLGAISEKELYAEHERQYGDFINLLFHSID